MTEKQNGKVDPVAIRELISQGIPMRRKESEIKHSQSEEQCVESERPNDESMSKDFSRHQRRERRKSDKGDYESLFICRNALKNRKTIYIAKDLQDTLAEIVMSMRNRDMTIGIYVENIILHHLETYKDEINRLAEMKFKKLLWVVYHLYPATLLPRCLFSIESDFVERNPNLVREYTEGDSFNPETEIELFTNDKAGKSRRARWYVVNKEVITTGFEHLNRWEVIVSSANAGEQKHSNQMLS